MAPSLMFAQQEGQCPIGVWFGGRRSICGNLLRNEEYVISGYVWGLPEGMGQMKSLYAKRSIRHFPKNEIHRLNTVHNISMLLLTM